jgi:SagB-type dehydrogenase family enzyme
LVFDPEIFSFVPGRRTDHRRKRRVVKQLSFEDLSAVLSFGVSAGISADPLDLFSLEIFCVITRNVDIGTGVFHLDRKDMLLQRVVGEMDPGLLSQCFDAPETAPMYILISGVFQRSALSYGEKGYRVVLTDSGRVAQNMLLAAERLGAHAKLESRFFEREIEKLIGIDGVDHALLQVISFSTVNSEI